MFTANPLVTGCCSGFSPRTGGGFNTKFVGAGAASPMSGNGKVRTPGAAWERPIEENRIAGMMKTTNQRRL